jgi:aminopeptidase-like protein
MQQGGAIEQAVAAEPDIGDEMMSLARELFPLPRSLTGDGVRETVRLISGWAPLEVTEVPSGAPVFDWTVPPEWRLREAWIRDSAGRTVVDGRDSSLRVLGYSEPVRTRLTGSELLAHLHSLPDHPDWIPYRTSYYDRAWGFCVTEHERRAVSPDETYDVLVDSALDAGSLTLAEHTAPGSTDEEVVVSTYSCHPSLANDNVSGLVVAAALARLLPAGGLRRAHRVLFAPSVIGALSWLERNQQQLAAVHCGVIASCLGDSGPLRWKQSRRGDTIVDRAAALVLRDTPGAHIEPFVPWGGDERQFCAPGFDLAFGSLSRSLHGEYPEYHTSADDLGLISPVQLAGSLLALARILDIVDADRTLLGCAPYGEPQLGRRGLYGSIGVGLPTEDGRRALLWVLNLADGRHSLVDVAERSGLSFWLLHAAAEAAREAGLVVDAGSV